MKKRCTKCKKRKMFELFPLRRVAKDGHCSWCNACHSKISNAWKKENPAKHAASQEKWAKANQKKNALQIKQCKEANPEKYAAAIKLWHKNNPGKQAAYTQARNAAKLLAIPKWANLKAVEKIYEKAAKLGLTVDHVVPLQSKLVCGLHWEKNLRPLSFLANSSKGNHHWPNMP